MRLLHLEDSDNDALLVRGLLRKSWPECSIERVKTRPEYEAALERGRFDLILSDFALDNFDGLTALELARTRCPGKPYVFISGTIGEERAIEALKLGASDYVLKDRPSRLVPAIRQALALAEEGRRRRESEEALRESHEKLGERAALLDKARDAIIATDLAYQITYWNASAERLYGWTAAEVIGRNIDELNFHADPARPTIARQMLQQEGEWRGEFHKRTKNGTIVHVETTWSLVMDAAGVPSSIMVIDIDVTEKRKAEGQALRAQRLDSLGMLAGGVAHDINNLLAPILMATELLRARLREPVEVQLLENINTGAQHGAALVRQLMAFARGAEGERTRIDVKELLDDVRVLLRTSLPKKVKLAVETENPRPILADPTQMKQVLLNLCLNARDTMPEGGRVEIRAENAGVDEAMARAHPGVSAGDYLRIGVRDTSAGIPPAIIERIFDPFFTTKGVGRGSGLGLSVVAGIVKSQGGFITVASEVGKGTVFELYFPAVA